MKKSLLLFKKGKVSMLLVLLSITAWTMKVYPNPVFLQDTCLPAKITYPELPFNIECSEIEGFKPPDLTYDNGQTGVCENNGTIAAQVTYLKDVCLLQILYEGTDDFGNQIHHQPNIEVIYNDIIVMPLNIPDTMTVTEARSFIPPGKRFTNGLTGDCGIDYILPWSDYYPSWDACNGGSLRIDYYGWLHFYHDATATGVVVKVIPDGKYPQNQFSLVSQETYNNPDKEYLNMDELLLANGGMVLGITGEGRSFTIPADGGQCIKDILPGAGTPLVLTGELGCENFGDLLEDGHLNNVLLSNAIVTRMNLWLIPSLGDLVLESNEFYTLASPDCLSESLSENTTMEDTLFFTIPSSVQDYLANKTVNEIFMLANDALGTSPWPSNMPPLSDINEALTVINEAFDGCRLIYFKGDCPAAVLIVPELPNRIDCSEAASFIAPDATYTNGLTGECENSGVITARVVSNIDKGQIDIYYDGLDDFGNPLSAIHHIYLLFPMPETTEPVFPESITTTEARSYKPGNITFANGLTGDCCINDSIEPEDDGSYWDECKGGQIRFAYVEYKYWLHDVYFKTVRINVLPNDSCSTVPVMQTPVVDGLELSLAPNPFKNSTRVSFSTSTNGQVIVEIYDLQGRLVQKLFDGNMVAGEERTIIYTVDESENQSPRICVIRTKKGLEHRLMLNIH